MKNKLNKSGNIVSGITALGLLLGACAGAPIKNSKPLAQGDIEAALAEAKEKKDIPEVTRLLLLRLGCKHIGLQTDGTAAECITSVSPDVGFTQSTISNRAKKVVGRAHALRNNANIRQFLGTTLDGKALLKTEAGEFDSEDLVVDPVRARVGNKNAICVRTKPPVYTSADKLRDSNNREKKGSK